MHVSLVSYDPNPDGTCRACRGTVHPETLLCTRCGTAHGEKNRCPHCRTIARTLPHSTLWHRCGVCGKPRVPPGPSQLPVSLVNLSSLAAAGQANRAATVLSVFSYLFIVAGLLSLLTSAAFLWVWEPQLAGMLVTLALASIPLVLGVFSRIASRQSTKSRDNYLEQAYAEQVISNLQSLGQSYDSRTIAAWLGLPLPRTEAILSRLNADDRMHSDVTDEGEVVYGALSSPTYRVESLGASTGVGLSCAPQRIPQADGEADAIVDAEFEEALDASAKQRKGT